MSSRIRRMACRAAALAVLVPCGVSAASNWGSFDESRINYPAGPLTGSAHTELRAIIEANGGTIAPPTGELTAGYMKTIDVFYTSLLSTDTGELSAAEQEVLQDWIAAGGTLIVTADIFPLNAYESFTAVYGVTDYVDVGAISTGSIVNAHPVTEDVSSFRFSTNSTYTFGDDGLLLGIDNNGRTFMIVMEPETGFDAGGRLLVFGDHNMFTNDLIGDSDNTQLAANMAGWAKTSVCVGDLDGDGEVGASDLADLLGAWGPNPGHPADLDGDDVVDANDLAILLGAWGPC